MQTLTALVSLSPPATYGPSLAQLLKIFSPCFHVSLDELKDERPSKCPSKCSPIMTHNVNRLRPLQGRPKRKHEPKKSGQPSGLRQKQIILVLSFELRSARVPGMRIDDGLGESLLLFGDLLQ